MGGGNATQSMPVHGGSPHALEARQCGIYQNGTAKLAACVTTINKWGNTEQVTGFLLNTGDVMVCDIKMKASGVQDIQSLWPDWAVNSSWERYF